MTLTGCESVGPLQRLPGHVMLGGFYINELLLRLLPRHDAHPALFEMYTQTLSLLVSPAQEQRALRIFEKHLLQELGYALILNHQVDTGEVIRPDWKYNYQLEKGPVRYNASRLRDITLHGRSLLALASEELHDPLSLRECKRLMRASLALYLGDRPLHSRKLASDFYKHSARTQGQAHPP
jgi:DNA repair protein RecO (recombination protein O)